MTLPLMLALACAPQPVDDTGPSPAPLTVVIQEIMADNASSWPDPAAEGCPEYDDWIELYNASAEPVELGGWGLSDDALQPGKLVLPAGALLPGDRLLVVADNDPEQGPLHAPFSLDAQGEEVVLTDPSGLLVDHLVFPALGRDEAWGRLGDGGTTTGRQPAPTPGAPAVDLDGGPCGRPIDAFADHTWPCIASVADFEAIAEQGVGLAVVKFEIPWFDDPSQRRVAWLDSAFYERHDEWYIFRMLNGAGVPGEAQYEPYDGSFATMDEIYAWARSTDLASLFEPRFLQWVGGRLTSTRFYDLTTATDPPVLGVGTLLQIPGFGGPDRWAFQLEGGDVVTTADITTYFEALRATLPAEIGDDLRWLVASTQQDEVAQALTGTPYDGRVLHEDDLIRAGAVEVYHPGLAAGQVLMVRAGEGGIERATDDDLLVLESPPDALPPGVALITAAPQTPLAHVALLAESRGIPNAYVEGVTEDAAWTRLAAARAWVAIRATTPDQLDVVELAPDQVATWQALRPDRNARIDPPAPVNVGHLVDLSAVSLSEMEDLRPAIGGKCAGFVALLSTPGVETPDSPLCVSVTAYREHIAGLGWLTGVLSDPLFLADELARERYLVLEGNAAFDQRYTEGSDQDARDAFLAAHPPGDRLGDLARGRGLRGAVEDRPIDLGLLAELNDALNARFGPGSPHPLAASQPLRLRSSSNVEDIAGFNGAGLYESFSGWLDPSGAPDPTDTVARALARVWGSYWGAEAFEERRAAGVPHDFGSMAVLVHPGFQDELERANGVVTLTRLPDPPATDAPGDRWRMVVNAQLGAVSVTNPPAGVDCRAVLPEVSELWLADGEATPRITRIAASSEAGGAPVMDDQALRALFVDVRAVLERWMEAENSELAPAQRRSTFTLDLEFRDVRDGWPAMADGVPRPGRLVVKQARPLEPGTDALPAEVLDGPYPRDAAARASAIDRYTCASDAWVLTAEQLWTDPLARPDMGFATDPLLVAVRLDVTDDVPALGWVAGQSFSADHTALSTTPAGGPGWALALTADAGVPGLGGGALTVTSGGGWTFRSADGAMAAGAVDDCAAQSIVATPDTWLARLFP